MFCEKTTGTDQHILTVIKLQSTIYLAWIRRLQIELNQASKRRPADRSGVYLMMHSCISSLFFIHSVIKLCNTLAQGKGPYGVWHIHK